jgi:hypothetical protein
MIALETNTRAPAKKSSRPALEIRLQFVDGSQDTFVQHDAEGAEMIRQRTNSSNLFTQSRIVIADDYSRRKDLLLSRRLGSGWFLIETASLVRDRQSQRLLWALRTQRVEPAHEAAFGSPTL